MPSEDRGVVPASAKLWMLLWCTEKHPKAYCPLSDLSYRLDREKGYYDCCSLVMVCKANKTESCLCKKPLLHLLSNTTCFALCLSSIHKRVACFRMPVSLWEAKSLIADLSCDESYTIQIPAAQKYTSSVQKCRQLLRCSLAQFYSLLWPISAIPSLEMPLKQTTARRHLVFDKQHPYLHSRAAIVMDYLHLPVYIRRSRMSRDFCKENHTKYPQSATSASGPYRDFRQRGGKEKSFTFLVL